MKYILLLILTLFIVVKLNLFKKDLLIVNGKVIFKSFNNYYTFDNLLQDLIKNNINDIKEIEKAYLKNGNLKIITSKPHVIISNGKIDEDELKKIDKNYFYIYNLLKQNKIKLEAILYGIYLKNELYIVKSIAK